MVSIMVTMVMIIVITLIVLGFSEVVRRNVRESLDSQLATQAYYAAETGINDVFNAVVGEGYTLTSDDATDCSHIMGGSGASLQNTLNADGSIAYTCVLAADKASNVVVNTGVGRSQNAVLNTNQAPGTLTFQWQASKAPTGTLKASNCSTAGANPNTFTPNSANGTEWQNRCPYGVLRVDLFNANAGAVTADTITDATVSIFFVPHTSSISKAITFSAPNRAVYTVQSKCVDAGDAQSSLCQGTISGLTSQNYYARLNSIYQSTGTVTITAGAADTTFSGYLIIDATGKAQDVLKRVVVRVPFATAQSIDNPVNALTSGTDICKRYVISGAGTRANGGDDSDIDTQLCTP